MSKQYTLDGRSFTLDDGLTDDQAYSIIQNFFREYIILFEIR